MVNKKENIKKFNVSEYVTLWLFFLHLKSVLFSLIANYKSNAIAMSKQVQVFYPFFPPKEFQQLYELWFRVESQWMNIAGMTADAFIQLDFCKIISSNVDIMTNFRKLLHCNTAFKTRTRLMPNANIQNLIQYLVSYHNIIDILPSTGTDATKHMQRHRNTLKRHPKHTQTR